jgi:predicted deacylase
MNVFLKYFLGLLPALIHGVSSISAAGSDKKAMVQASLSAVAEGVTAIAPEHGPAATEAASVASNAIDGVYQVLKLTGKLATPATPTA